MDVLSIFQINEYVALFCQGPIPCQVLGRVLGSKNEGEWSLPSIPVFVRFEQGHHLPAQLCPTPSV